MFPEQGFWAKSQPGWQCLVGMTAPDNMYLLSQRPHPSGNIFRSNRFPFIDDALDGERLKIALPRSPRHSNSRRPNCSVRSRLVGGTSLASLWLWLATLLPHSRRGHHRRCRSNRNGIAFSSCGIGPGKQTPIDQKPTTNRPATARQPIAELSPKLHPTFATVNASMALTHPPRASHSSL